MLKLAVGCVLDFHTLSRAKLDIKVATPCEIFIGINKDNSVITLYSGFHMLSWEKLDIKVEIICEIFISMNKDNSVINTLHSIVMI